ncbi:MAG TPA: ABC transporter substrate-binding protein [Anaerolineales bacterium]
MNKSKVNGMARKLGAPITWIVLIALLLSGCGSAQQAKVYHVGIVYTQSTFGSIVDGFKAQMTTLGYVEGKNIVYDVQLPTNTGTNTIQSVNQKFVSDKVDLIFAFATSAAQGAKTATQGTNIPVIFAFSTIEGTGLVDSVSQPGGNITGVRYPGAELTAKRFEILKELLPQLKRLDITYEAAYPTNQGALDALRPAAAAAGVTLIEDHITKVEDISTDLNARVQGTDPGMDAILIMPENLTQTTVGWGAISQFAADHRVPIAGNAVNQAQQGALFSYAPDLTDNGTQAALLADKIFKGIPAGTIPVVTPQAQLTLNYKVAQQLGITIPDDLLKQAATIIR